MEIDSDDISASHSMSSLHDIPMLRPSQIKGSRGASLLPPTSTRCYSAGWNNWQHRSRTRQSRSSALFRRNNRVSTVHNNGITIQNIDDQSIDDQSIELAQAAETDSSTMHLINVELQRQQLQALAGQLPELKKIPASLADRIQRR